MDLDILDQLDATSLRSLLPGYLAGFVQGAEEKSRQRTTAALADWSDAQLDGLLHTLRTIGEDETFYAANPDGRVLSRTWCEDAIPDGTVDGVEHLKAAMAAGPTILVGNHLSYFDSTAIDALLAWNGAAEEAGRVFSAAGPKVYESLFRRVAAACINTLKVPQSTSIGYTAKLSRRELARKAIASLRANQAALADDYALLIYPEGSRTRTGRLGSFLRAVHRYLKVDGAQVVPFALSGTQRVMPVGEDLLTPGSVHVSFGPPIPVDDSQAALERAHSAVSELLPASLKPDPATPATH